MKKIYLTSIVLLCCISMQAQEFKNAVYKDSILVINPRKAFNNVVYEKSGQMHKTEVDFDYVLGLRTNWVHISSTANGQQLGWDFELYRSNHNIQVAASYVYEGQNTYTDRDNSDRVPVKRSYVLTFKNGDTYDYVEPFYSGNSSYEVNLILSGPVKTLAFDNKGDALKNDKIMHGDTVLLRKMLNMPLKNIQVTEYIDERFHKYRPRTMGVVSRYMIALPPNKGDELMQSLQSLVNYKM